MRPIALVILCLCPVQLVVAQFWKSATINTTSGEAVRGAVYFGDWEISPDVVQVKLHGEEQQREYNGSEMKSFTLDENNRRYDFLRIKLRFYKETVTRKHDGAQEDALLREDSASVFAELVFDNGSLRMYSVGDENKIERFFVSKGSANPTELSYITYKIIDVRKRDMELAEKKYFRIQLIQLVSDCRVPVRETIPYAQKEITEILEAYSECKGLTTKKKAKLVLVNLGAMAAVNHVTDWEAAAGIRAEPAFGISLQMLSKKSFGNNFALIEAAFLTNPIFQSSGGLVPPEWLYLGLYGGRFLGKGKFQGVIYSGASRFNGLLDTGAGISYTKRLTLSANVGLLQLARDEQNFTIKLRYHPRLKADNIE